jgi:hypothetical protein
MILQQPQQPTHSAVEWEDFLDVDCHTRSISNFSGVHCYPTIKYENHIVFATFKKRSYYKSHHFQGGTKCSVCSPLMWVALTWQGAESRFVRAWATKNLQAIYQCDGTDCRGGNHRCPMHIRCLTGRIVFLLFLLEGIYFLIQSWWALAFLSK